MDKQKTPIVEYTPLDDEKSSGQRSSSQCSICFEVGVDLKPKGPIRKCWNLLGMKHFLGALAMLSVYLIGAFSSPVWTRRPQRLNSLSPIPDFPTETVVYQQDPRFSARRTAYTDKLWMELLGETKGFVKFDDPQGKHDLPLGILNADGTQNYGIAVFHQLHCLLLIRNQYFQLLDGSLNLTNYRLGKDGILEAEVKHIQHCYDYIRQGIMCAGDMTVEWPENPNVRDVDGEFVPHQCKSWSSITKWMKDKMAVAEVTPARAGHGGHLVRTEAVDREDVYHPRYPAFTGKPAKPALVGESRSML